MLVENQEKMDLTDRRIMLALDENSRQSYTSIGKIIRKSPQTTKYRIERLARLGIIKHLYPLIEYRALGYQKAGFFIKLEDISPTDERRLLDYLYRRPQFQNVLRVEGKYDLYIAIFAKDLFALEMIIKNLKNEFGKMLQNFEYVNELSSIKYSRNYLQGKKDFEQKNIEIGRLHKVHIDAVDSAIISQINLDPRISIRDIAKQVQISIDIALYRLRKLTEQKIISGYTIALNHKKVKRVFSMILLKTTNLNKKIKNELYSFCSLSSKVVEISKCIGTYDLIIFAETKNQDSYRYFLKELKYRFSSVIYDDTSLNVYSLEKYRTFPTEVFMSG